MGKLFPELTHTQYIHVLGKTHCISKGRTIIWKFFKLNCPWFYFCWYDKTPGPKAAWEERVNSAYTSREQCITEWGYDRSSRHELKQKPWSNAAYWLALELMVSLLHLLQGPGLPAQEWCCPLGWALLNQSWKCFTDTTKDPSNWGNSSVVGPSAQVCQIGNKTSQDSNK